MEAKKSKVGYLFIPANSKKIFNPSVSVDFEGIQDVWVNGFCEHDPYEQIPVNEYNEIDLITHGNETPALRFNLLKYSIKENEHNLFIFADSRRSGLMNELEELGYKEFK
jgi:hypothetical protein